MTRKPAETGPLMTFIVALLTPLLLTSGITDIVLARQAARQAIDAYNAAGNDQLVTVAQVVGFALASLDNLRLSVEPDRSVSMILKLRGNANALNRATQRSTAALELQRRDNQDETDQQAALASLEQAQAQIQPNQPQPNQPQPTELRPTELRPTQLRPTQLQPTEPQPTQLQPNQIQPTELRPTQPAPKAASVHPWASAMTQVAAEYARDLAKLPPDQRRAEIIRIGALSQAATHLAGGPAFQGKAALLATTTLGTL